MKNKRPINPFTGQENSIQPPQVVVGIDAIDQAQVKHTYTSLADSDLAVSLELKHTEEVIEALFKIEEFLNKKHIATGAWLVFMLLIIAVLLGSYVRGRIVMLALILAVVGVLVIERLPAVRRYISIVSLVTIAGILTGEFFNMMFDYDIVVYFFMLLSFVSSLFFSITSLVLEAALVRGIRVGHEEADIIISDKVIDRLIEHPCDWNGKFSEDYLKTEAAISQAVAHQQTIEQKARDEAHRKDDLVTYLAHDLRTPLASVIGYLSLLDDAPDLPEEQRKKFVGITLGKANRLDALTEDFFDIVRFDFHDIVVTCGYVQLEFMLAQIVDEFYPLLQEQHKTVEIDVDPGLVVLIDADKMARVFNNIMKNALAYSYENTVITIRVDQDDDNTTIEFINHGDPIPKPKLDVIFEKFYRLDAARTTNHGGAGLGLAIAKEIVEAHGGAIACCSTAESTVFTIVIPNK